MLDFSEYYTYFDPLPAGETVSVNHIDCPAGTDTKGRLYLTRPAGTPNIVLGYCHNCGESGVKRGSDSEQYRAITESPTTRVNTSVFSVPVGLIIEPKRWPIQATVWRIQKCIPESTIRGTGIAYDPHSNSIYLPIYNTLRYEDNEWRTHGLKGYQLRHLGGGSKYTTCLKDNLTPMTSRIYGKIYSKVPIATVLVEDLASALVVTLAASDNKSYTVDVICNYGIQVKPETLQYTGAPGVINTSDKNVNIVWLDNDNDTVIRKALDIANVWKMVSGTTTYIENTFSDPKNHSHDEIREVIDNHVYR